MRFTVASLACIVAGASAFQYPDFVPLHKRQAPGTPQYDCHANCGGVITASRQDDFCDSSDFESMLSACLDCALVYDIWRYYGNSVGAAAEECGLDGTPVEPTSSSTTTTATETTTETTTETETSSSTETETETETEPTTTATSTSTQEPTETVSSTTVSSTSTPVIPTVTTTTTTTPPPGSTTSPTPGPEDPEDPAFTGAAALNTPAGLFMGGLVGSLIAALM
ncbi:hypothetical protein ASPCAL11978 [Aspergillus calidoustus]|uniref:GPI anchored protein n=1 Tax=Aspergillus calidoustus TaxID=454130 RepID=A0A0U5G9R4_ASPCI|nr:hypothetical protein ASPCAL11978 [Aspergillus calidoustus]